MDKLNLLSAADAVSRIRSGEATAVQLMADCLDQITRYDEQIRAWEYLDSAGAIAQAEAVDERLREGSRVGPLTGVPVGVKDIFNTKDMPTCMGSPIFKDFTPGNDARVVFMVRQGGATIPGKTVTAEFAVHALDKTLNPNDGAYSPGTSSSGSAAAVAAGMVPLALGTQTAGSIVRPASYCGVYGMKPSFGLIPRTGMLKTTDTLDQVGFFARCVDDLELLFDVVRVRGRDYPISHAMLGDEARRSVKGRPWRIGVVAEGLWVWGEAAAYAKRAFQTFVETLARTALNGVQPLVEAVKLPESFNTAHDLHAVIYNKTLAYYFREEFENHQLISEILNSMILAGQKITLDEYKQALERQTALARQLDEVLQRYDVVIALSTAGSAPKWGEEDVPDSCLVWSLCGVPVVSVPVFAGPNGLPFGAQVLARRYSDYLLLDFLRHLKLSGLIRDAAIPARMRPQVTHDAVTA